MTTPNESTNTPTKNIVTFRFLDYRVYQDSKHWFQEVISLKGLLEPNSELWSPLKNSMVSVMMNIAASSTKLPSEARKYLGNAITAANKSIACLDVACDEKVISSEEFQLLSQGFEKVIIQLKSMIKSLGSKPVNSSVPATN